ncbi:Retrovirus-related Pol polyprotein from transposon RE2 [Vitis vinifera]|uniref:Retrovirus-related Pol polyprotein from transposon RE2 n=1 Tax=Vitis vinifera TaxID=29760 RepID=A0A438FMW2_VITVI|nr:Retrovirus-related Pol polyprotein from transposon RE2 [Vitis vinifera]
MTTSNTSNHTPHPYKRTCQLCGVQGHSAKRCPSFRYVTNQHHGVLPNYNYHPSSAQTRGNSTNYCLSLNWLLDSSVSHHISNDLQNLSLHSDYAGPDDIIIGDSKGLEITQLLQDNTILDTTLVEHLTIHDTTLAGQLIILSPNAETTQHPTYFLSKSNLVFNPHPAPSLIPPTRPPTLNTHPLVTRSKNNVFKSSTKYALVFTTPNVAPTCVTQALKLLE